MAEQRYSQGVRMQLALASGPRSRCAPPNNWSVEVAVSPDESVDAMAGDKPFRVLSISVGGGLDLRHTRYYMAGASIKQDGEIGFHHLGQGVTRDYLMEHFPLAYADLRAETIHLVRKIGRAAEETQAVVRAAMLI